MKKRLAQLLLLMLISCTCLIAQPKNFMIVKAGHTIRESLTPEELYQYPQFTQGTIYLKNSKKATVPLNYNRFLDALQFINTKGDTLILNNVEDIEFINAGNDTFFYNNGLVKLVSAANNVKLAIKQTINMVNKEKISDGYGSTSSTTAIDVYESFPDRVKNFDISVMENLVLGNKVQYFFANKENNFVPANKRNLLKLFTKRKTDVENYLKNTAVNFDSEDDLKKLVQYLGGL